MRKFDELTNQNSCWNKALVGEQVFVLIGRDPAMPAAIIRWVEERIKLGKNTLEDPQIQEALQLAADLIVDRFTEV